MPHTLKARMVMVHHNSREHVGIVIHDHGQHGEHHLVDVSVFPDDGGLPVTMKSVRLFTSHSEAKSHHEQHGHAVAHLIVH